MQKGGPSFPPTPHTDEFTRVVFKNGIFLGLDAGTEQEPDYWKSHFGPVISAWSQDLKIDLFQIDSCVFRNLAFGCNFNCSGSGRIRNAILSNCQFDNIVQDPTLNNDQYRGKGAAFSFRPQEEMLLDEEDIEYICGISYGNVFKDCVRHCLYISQGGPFLSVGDKFFNHSKDVTPQFAVGALQFSRGGRMQVIGAYFQDCHVGINVSPTVHFKEVGSGEYEAIWELRDVTIEDCTFIDSKSHDVVLNGGGPYLPPPYDSQNPNLGEGVFTNVVVNNTKHVNKDPTSKQFVVHTFRKMVLRNIDIEIDQRDNDGGEQDNNALIEVYGWGSCNPYSTSCGAEGNPNPGDDEVKNDDLVIDGITARFLPNPPQKNARVIILHPNVYEAKKSGQESSENHQPRVKIRNVDTNGTPVFLSPHGDGVVTNPNLKWSWF